MPRTPRRTSLGWIAVLAAVVVVAIAVPALASSLSAKPELPEPIAVERAEPPTTTTTAPPPPPPTAPLTGIELHDPALLHRPALVVKVDNVPRARPQAGLRQADVVVEERVEGNVSRLVAIYHSQDAPGVGPVRSVRTTDLEIVSLLGRVLFASSGGNGGVVPQLHAADVVDIGHNMGGGGFHRAGHRPAPHKLFTSTPELYGKAPEQPGPPRPMFAYRAPGEPLAPGAVPSGGISLSFGGGEVSRFHWDPATGTWHRWQAGTPHLDADGVLVTPRNVVVAGIDYDMSGQAGRSVPHGIVTGEGPALVLTDGHAILGRWVRPGLGDPLQLLAADGSEIRLSPGQTFLELPPKGAWHLF
jgi:hypothetical protein